MELRRLSVLVPVYNEVGTVRTLLERVMAVPIPKEIRAAAKGNKLSRSVNEESNGKGADRRPSYSAVLCWFSTPQLTCTVLHRESALLAPAEQTTCRPPSS